MYYDDDRTTTDDLFATMVELFLEQRSAWVVAEHYQDTNRAWYEASRDYALEVAAKLHPYTQDFPELFAEVLQRYSC